MAKLGIIGNCQATWLNNALHFFDHDVVGHLLVFATTQEKTEDFLRRLGSCTVISHEISDKFGVLCSSSMRRRGNPYFTTTNIHFSGLHPDITSIDIPSLYKRLQSPMGDYHSRIILYSYMNGFSINDCIRLFNSDIYEKAGYFAEFEKSSIELLRRDENLDIQFAERFLNLLTERPCLYTLNHPSLFIVFEQARMISEHLKGEHNAYPSDYFRNDCSISEWWPVYPEIGEFHNLKYSTPMLFKKRDRFMPLAEFISKSYESYEQTGKPVLLAAKRVHEIQEQFSFLR